MRLKNEFHIFTKSALSFAIALSTHSTATLAKEQSLVIEEVVVTAQKKSESMQDTPIAITAFTEDSLEQMGIKNASDVGEFTPNITIGPSIGSKFNIRMYIRGKGTAEPSLTIDPKVGIYLDGVYMARNSGAIFDVVDLERIEVLRGPQGTLWGKNTTGGAINMVTAKPEGEFKFKQQITGGSNGQYRSITTIDTPPIGNASAKLSYVLKGQDGWAKNTHTNSEKELGSEDTEAYRIALRWEANDRFSLDYSFDQTNGEATPVPVQVAWVNPSAADNPTTFDVNALNESGAVQFIPGNAFAQMALIANPDRQDTFNIDAMGAEDMDIKGHNLTLTWQMEALELKSISAYREYDSFMPTLNSGGGAYYDDTGASLPAFHSTGTKSQHQFSQELQAVGAAMDGQLEYVLGLYHFQEKGKEINPWNISSYRISEFNGQVLETVIFVDSGVFYKVESTSNALYGQFDYNLSDQWTLTLGMRYTEDEKEIVYLSGQDKYSESERTKEDDWGKFTGAFTANFELNDDISLYGKASSGYAAGVYNAGPIDDPTVVKPADPEETTSYEFGAKSMLAGGRVQLNAALFYNDSKNLQITAFEGNTRVTNNSGKSDSQGIEFEFLALASESVTLNANYGYIDVNYDDAGRDQLAPRNSFSLGAQYDYPVSVGLLTARLDASHSSKQYFSTDLEDREINDDARALFNARFSLSEVKVADGVMTTALWGRNLTDKEYRVHGVSFGGVVPDAAYNAYSWGEPRTFGIDLRWDY